MIPPFADVICDCRALPGETEDDPQPMSHAALGDDLSYELELLEPLAGGTESPIDDAALRGDRALRRRARPGGAAAAR